MRQIGKYIFSDNPAYPAPGHAWAHADNWMRWLAPYIGQQSIHALEVGTFEGFSALWLMDNVLTDQSSSITCIDCWDDDVNDGMGGEDALSLFRSNVTVNGRGWAWHIWRGRSDYWLSHLRVAPVVSTYSICYIDGGHDARTVLADSLLAWPLVKSGGTIIWDDYQWPGGNTVLDRPHIAIDAFLSIHEGTYEILSMDYQVAVRKL